MGTHRPGGLRQPSSSLAGGYRAISFTDAWVNGYSRHMERQADAYALRATRNRPAFISSMEKLARQNLAQRRPHPLMEFIFHSHPSIEKRIAFAKQKPY